MRQQRNKIVSARITQDEYRDLVSRARKQGLPLSEYIRVLITTVPVEDEWLSTYGGGTFTVATDTRWVTLNG